MKTFRIFAIHKIDQVLKTYQFLRNLKLTAYRFHFALFSKLFSKLQTSFSFP